MKKCFIVWSLTLAIFFPVLGHAVDFGNTYLRYMEGDVLVQTVDTTEWLPASSNMPLRDGDKIWSPDNGRVELFLRNGTMVRLDRNTYLEILVSEDKLARFYLAQGHIYANAKVAQGDVVVMDTPTASLRAYGQSVFRIDVAENEDTDVAVLRGEIFMDRQSGQMKINAGDRIIVRNNNAYPERARMASADQWEQWNRQRDYDLSLFQSGNSVAYLPDELKAYAPDLERNGRWAYEEEYGYVWTPTVVVAQTWSPYSEGRWVWMNGDYVWISHESWGWAPHHYGRWVFVNHRGWSWVPPGRGSAHWGPGYVGWVHTSTHISWVPLAPRDLYYGHGNFGAHSVNMRNVTNRNSTINNKVEYKNVRVRNAVRTIQRNTFANGRPTSVNTKDNLFLKEKSVMAAPEKTTMMPVVKDIPLTKLPPQKIRERASIVNKNNNSPLTGDYWKGGAPSVLLNAKNRPQLLNDRKIDAPQRVNDVPQRIEQRKPIIENQDLRKGPLVESGKERAVRRLNELRVNNSARSITKEVPLQPPQALLTNGSEKKVDIARKNPEVVEVRQPVRTKTEQRPMPGALENTRPPLPAYVNNPVPKPQVQPPKRDENIVVGSRTMPQGINREIQPEKKREVIVAPRSGEMASVRPPDRIKPEPNRNSNLSNVRPPQVEQRRPAPVEKEMPEKRTEMKRVDQKPDTQHQPAPVKIFQVNESNRGSTPDVPVPAGKPKGRNEGRNAGR